MSTFSKLLPIAFRIGLIYLFYIWLPFPVFLPLAGLVINNTFNIFLTYYEKKPLIVTYGIWGIWILVGIIQNAKEMGILWIIVLAMISVLCAYLPILMLFEFFKGKKGK